MSLLFPYAFQPDTQVSWARWAETPVGQYLLSWEKEQCDQVLAKCFGCYAVQFGLPALKALQVCPIAHRFVIDTGGCPTELSGENRLAPGKKRKPAMPRSDSVDLILDTFDQLPFRSQTLNLVVLPHTLERSHNPHAVLQEAERVLRADGRILLTGFNPTSFWIAKEHFCRLLLKRRWLPDDTTPIWLTRLREWLRSLGFELESSRYGAYRLFPAKEHAGSRSHFIELAGDRWWPSSGALYSISAVKRARTLTFVGPVALERGKTLLVAGAR